MKAVVLAAGKGVRLGPLTESLPKPMLPISGRPVIGHLLSTLAKTGVREVFMNLHHRPETIQDYCEDGSRWGLRITYAIETELLGTAGALRSFMTHLTGEPFFVSYGDNFFTGVDPVLLWEFHQRHDGHATVALFERDDVRGCGIVELNQHHRILRFVEKPPPEQVFSRLINGGLYVLSPAILPLLPDRTPCDFAFHVFPELLAAGHPIFGRVMEGAVWGIDTPELYRTLREIVSDELA